MWGWFVSFWKDISFYRTCSTPRLPWRTALVYAESLRDLRRRYKPPIFRPVKLGEFAKLFLEFVIERRDPAGFRRGIVVQATGISQEQWDAVGLDQVKLYLAVRDSSPEIVRPRAVSTLFQIDEATIPPTDLGNWALAKQMLDTAEEILKESDSVDRLTGIIVTANPETTAARLGEHGVNPAAYSPHRVVARNNLADVAYVRYQHAPAFSGDGERIAWDYILLTLPDSTVDRTAALAVITRAFRHELLQPIVVRCRHHYGFHRVIESVQESLEGEGIPRETSAACCAIIHELAVGVLIAGAWPQRHFDEILTFLLGRASQRKDSLRQIAFAALHEAVVLRRAGASLPGKTLDLISRILGAEQTLLEETLRDFADSFLDLDPFNLQLKEVQPCVHILAKRCPELLAALSWESLAAVPPEALA
jgi:hypothetical protein